MTATPYRDLLRALAPSDGLHLARRSSAARAEMVAMAGSSEKITSLHVPLPPIDPLAVYQQLAGTLTACTYWENRAAGLAMFAADVRCSRELAGEKRFTLASEFVADTKSRIVRSDTNDRPSMPIGSHPCFFGSFAFADDDSSCPNVIYLPAWHVYRHGDRCGLVVNLSANHLDENLDRVALPQVNRLIERIIDRVRVDRTHLGIGGDRIPWEIAADSQDLSAKIRRVLTEMARRNVTKVVLSRTLEIVADANIDPIATLDRLRHAYPDCYTFAHRFSTSGSRETFLGASPERLLGLMDGQLTVDALAGSAPRGSDSITDRQLADALMASDKERREHQLVRDFIVDRLEEMGIQPQIATAPQVRTLANIHHLWTPIRAIVEPPISPLNLVDSLHPTPALAGVPRAAALASIRACEDSERGRYAAPIGWLDTAGNGEFIAGIRSALVKENRARLYAGAGIVAGSEPDREVAEIALKLQPLLQSLSLVADPPARSN
jgi:menaquinone-specific isochorismate synthase